MFSILMKRAAVIATLLTVLMIGIYLLLPMEIWETLAITCGTAAYHLEMRLLVGAVYNSVLHNRVNYHHVWFRERRFEHKLYKLLRVRSWKGRMPTYDPFTFDVQSHTLEELCMATCQSELVHETIALLSFLPLFAAIPFGAFPVFVITSVVSALFDTLFVILQRYNRPRLLRLLKRQQSKANQQPYY